MKFIEDLKAIITVQPENSLKTKTEISIAIILVIWGLLFLSGDIFAIVLMAGDHHSYMTFRWFLFVFQDGITLELLAIFSGIALLINKKPGLTTGLITVFVIVLEYCMDILHCMHKPKHQDDYNCIYFCLFLTFLLLVFIYCIVVLLNKKLFLNYKSTGINWKLIAFFTTILFTEHVLFLFLHKSWYRYWHN